VNPAAIPDRLGEALADRYRLESELGQGGMATVYLAEDLKHKRKVALKVLTPELAAVLGAERFVQEITTTASLQHPHILPLFDSGSVDGFLYYVMPYIEGETLRDRLNRETQLPVEDAVRITCEIADALDYAHRHGVIHRDIKPENILLHDGRPMVADFGIALALSAAAGGRMTETGMSLGTPHYMSPEQATADKDITARSDVYSLGSVLYEMLTGEPPHMGNSAQAIIMKIVTEDATPVTRLRKSVPPNVTAAVGKALEKLPADRFDSAKAFADALADPAFMTVSTTRVSTRPRVHASASVPLAAAVVILALAAAWGWLRSPSSGRPTGTVRFSIPLSSDTAAARRMSIRRDSRTSQLAFSPAGSLLVYDASDSGRPSLWARYMDREPEVLLAATDSVQYAYPFFSPDGVWVGFVAFHTGGSPLLQRLSLADRSVETIGSLDSIGPGTGVTWGDDGTIIMAREDRLYRIPAAGGQWTTLAEAQPPAGQSLRWYQPVLLPGSRTLLFHAAHSYDPARSDIVALTLATGEQRTVLTNAMNPIFVPGDYLLFVRQGTLMGVRFDAGRAEVQGEPVVLMSNVMQSVQRYNTVWETGAAQVAVSAAGDLAYARGGLGAQRPLRVARLTPRGDTVLIATEPAAWYYFRLSPDGTRLAMVSFVGLGTQIGIHDLNRGITERPATGGYSNYPVVWSPDGRWIAFSSDRDTLGSRNIYRMPSDGSGTPERLFPSDSSQVMADWSPQGVMTYLQCGRGRDEDVCDIYVAPADSAPRRFVAAPGGAAYPTFSPDGRWLAYAADQGGRLEVFVRPYPAGEPATRVSTSGGDTPMWSRDGRMLLYKDVQNRIWALDVAPGPELRAGHPRPYPVQWTRGTGPIRMEDIFPDGSVVVPIADPSVAPQPGGASQIEVIVNYLSELRQRVGQ